MLDIHGVELRADFGWSIRPSLFPTSYFLLATSSSSLPTVYWLLSTGYFFSLAQILQQLEHGQKERDDDGADDAAQDDDHQRLQKADQTLHEHVHFLIVNVGDLIEHRVQFARLLADVHHVHNHVIHQPAFLQGL